MNECERFQEMISALLDGELSAEEEAELRAHMAECPDCAAMAAAFAAVSEAVAAQDVPATLHDGIMAKVRAAEKAGKIQHTIVRLRPILAAAACLVVVIGTVFALRNTLHFGRSAAKSADAAASIAAEPAAAPDSATAAGGAYKAESAIAKDDALMDSRIAVDGVAESTMTTGAGAVADAGSPVEEPKEPVASFSTNDAYGTAESTEEGYCFTVRVEALTEDGFTGVVTDVGDQTFFAVGQRVTVLTDGAEAEEWTLGELLSVTIAADEAPADGAVRALTLAAAE